MSPQTMAAISHYAAISGANVCHLYRKFNAILARHGHLIHTRWREESGSAAQSFAAELAVTDDSGIST